MNLGMGELIAEELAKAGTDPELIAKLKKDRITADKELPPMEFLLKLFDVPCCPRGELVAFTGKAKSGKTFVMSMMMAAASAAEALAFHRMTFEPLQVLWIDTEQSDQSTQDILRNRLIPMVISSPPKLGGARGGLKERTDSLVQTTPPVGTPPNLGGETFPEYLYDIFNVRTESWQERLPLLMAAIDMCRPDLVILDGVRDLVDDINNGQLAHDVTERLMRVAQQARCCIVCVIHQNKAAEDRTLRGSIGTELTNKAFEVYECEKMMPSRTFVLTQKLTRKYDITDSLYFTVDDRGLPHQVGASATTTQSQSKPDASLLFRQVLAGHERLSGDELRSKVMAMAGMTSFKAYGLLLEKVLKEGIILLQKEKRRIWYSLAGPE